MPITKDINIQTTHGNLRGVIAGNSDDMRLVRERALSFTRFNQSYYNAFSMIVDEVFSSMAYLQVVMVDTSNRLSGHGVELMEQFLELTQDVELRMLLIPQDEKLVNAASGMDVVRFFKRFGFTLIMESDGVKMMVQGDPAKVRKLSMTLNYEFGL